MGNFQIAGYAFDQALFLEWAQKLAIAAAIIIGTWLAAKAAKWAFARMIDQIAFFRRGTSSGESLGMALGRIVSLIIWLFGLLAVLQQLGFDSVMQPVEAMLGNFIGYIDNIVFAVALFFIGTKVAGVVRDLTETTLATINFDRWANMGGAEAMTGNGTISKTIGRLAYVFVIIPISIGALGVLDIPSITEPAQNLLDMVLKAILPIIGACLLLGLGYVISRWISELIRELLPNLGVDRSIDELGILPDNRRASGVIATIVTIAIMIFFAIAATHLLGFPQLTDILQTVLAQGGQVVFGAVIIAFGFLIARILQNLIADATGAGLAPNIAYWLTVSLFVFIGLQQMNIGGPIIEYAFGALAIGAAVAFALAFGLGGREAAAEVLADMRANPPKAPTPKTAAPKAAVRKAAPKK